MYNIDEKGFLISCNKGIYIAKLFIFTATDIKSFS